MNLAAILHLSNLEDTFAVAENQVMLRLRTAHSDCAQVTLVSIDFYRHIFHNSHVFEESVMKLVARDHLYDYYETVITHEVQLIAYYFRLSGAGETICYGNGKFYEEKDREIDKWYSLPNVKADDLYRLPEWTKEAVVYQVFPDSFYRGDGADFEGWYRGPRPAEEHLGGTLQGVMDKLDYIQSLGATVLYLTPVFVSPTNHKYHITDFYEVDPHLGTKEQFIELVDSAHARGMRVLLDGVFHSTGIGFFAFQDVVKKGPESEYWDWFLVNSFPVQTEYPINYAAWGHLREMPNLNLDNPAVVEYLLDVMIHWVREMDIDGWRLDTVDKLSNTFLQEAHRRLTTVKPDCILVGELWYDARPWLRKGLLDTVMNYRFTRAVSGFFAHKDMTPSAFSSALGQLRGQYPYQAWVGLWNILSSHDIQRFLTEAGNDVRAQELAVLFQFTYPGTPFIYAGDELGMTGHSLICRDGLVWDEGKQNHALLTYYRRLGKVRRIYPALLYGDFEEVLVSDHCGLYGFKRYFDGEEIRVLFNIGSAQQTIEVPPGSFDLLSDVQINMDSVTLQPKSAIVLLVSAKHR